MHKVKFIWHGMYDTRDEQIRQLCFLSGVAAADTANIANAATDTQTKKNLYTKMENSRNYHKNYYCVVAILPPMA